MTKERLGIYWDLIRVLGNENAKMQEFVIDLPLAYVDWILRRGFFKKEPRFSPPEFNIKFVADSLLDRLKPLHSFNNLDQSPFCAQEDKKITFDP